MATGQWSTINDVISRTTSEGNMGVIAEMLATSSQIYEDMLMKEASEIGGHEFIFRTSIPTGYFTTYNRGVPVAKSTTNKGRVGIGRLEVYSQIDYRLAMDTGTPEDYRLSEDQAFIQGMSQTMAKTIFYGNTAVDPAQFMGFSSFYNTVNPALQPNAVNVLDGGGTGSSNSSLWLIGWGEREIFGIYPRGSTGGFIHENLGRDRPGRDSAGDLFETLTSRFEHKLGICPMNWQYGVRLANLDVTSNGLNGPNADDLFVQMARMVRQTPVGTKESSGITQLDAPSDPSPGVRFSFYSNRTVTHFMEVQSIRGRNVLLHMDEYAGRTIMSYRGYPIKIVDQLLTTEAQVV